MKLNLFLQSYLAYIKRKIESRHDSHQEHGKDVSITHASQRLPAKQEGEEEEEEEEEEYLIRDDFNLHKIIIAITKAGKVRDITYMFLVLVHWL